MDEAVSFLKDWFIRFLENRDLVRKNIVGIEDKEELGFVVNYRDKAVNFIIMPILENNILERINNKENFGLVTLNNPQNLKFVYINWKRFVENKPLSLYFVNPFSNTDKVWILCPSVHDRICDRSSLELGLKAMADMVEPISYEGFAKRFKQERQAAGPRSR